MLSPVKLYNFSFTSDNQSTSLEIDLSVIPVEETFAGNQPQVVFGQQVIGNGQVVQGVQASLEGTTVTLTFPAPPPQFDANNNLIVYNASFYLQYGV
jgi:hypothetical protein